MDTERCRALNEQLEALIHLTPLQRSIFLADMQGKDPEMASDLRALLDAEDIAVDFMAEPVAIPIFAEGIKSPGSLIGPYRVLSLLGEGGMGRVYLAERMDGTFDKRVALKQVRPGIGLDTTLRLFRKERFIHARMNHPNIVHIMDAGSSEDDYPYLVMEYVEGTNIDAYCDKNRLNIRQRLSLFALVCRAVHFMHGHMVIHRDLKPANILVTDSGQPKLLDFGIARLMESDPNLTVTAAKAMSPAYASPEQILGDPLSIATDVYSLGVVLYELLCGISPYQAENRLPGSLERAICYTEPIRPKHLLRGRKASAPKWLKIADSRACSRAALARALSGDLEKVLFKALTKEPGNRYQSALEMAEDLERYLNGFPVRAVPASSWKQAAKFIKRHKAMLFMTAILCLSLLGFSINAFLQQERLTRERDLARNERAKAEVVSKFLTDLITGASPEVQPNADITLRELLIQSHRQILESPTQHPVVQAQVLDAIGATYYGLGDYKMAARIGDEAALLSQDAPIPDLDVAASALANAGRALWSSGKIEEAKRRFLDALRLLEEKDNAFVRGKVFDGLAALNVETGNLPQASDFALRALALHRKIEGEHSKEVANNLNTLGAISYYQKDSAQAIAYWQEALNIQEVVLGPNHGDVATACNNLSVVYRQNGDHEKAESHAKKALSIYLVAHSQDHADLAPVYNNLAHIFSNKGELNDAAHYFHRDLEISRATLGERHPVVLNVMLSLAATKQQLGDFTEAESLRLQSIAILKEDPNLSHKDLISALIAQSEYQRFRGDYAKTRLLLDEAKSLLKENDRKELQMLQYHTARGTLLQELGDLEGAFDYAAAARDLLPGSGSLRDEKVYALIRLSQILSKMELFPEAVPYLERADSGHTLLWATKGPHKADILINRAALSIRLKDWAQANAHANEAQKVLEKSEACHPDLESWLEGVQGLLQVVIGKNEDGIQQIRKAYDQLVLQRGAGAFSLHEVEFYLMSATGNSF